MTESIITVKLLYEKARDFVLKISDIMLSSYPICSSRLKSQDTSIKEPRFKTSQQIEESELIKWEDRNTP
jgi:hypothetical protein